MANLRLLKNKGSSLLETVFYISLLAILSLLVVNAIITMSRSFRETSIYTELTQSSSIIDRISREIRQATGIVSISSSELKLNTKDEAGNAKTVQFSLSGTNINYYENDVLTGSLNTEDIAVSSLTFIQITTDVGSAIKIGISLHSLNDTQNRTVDFYNTAVLRGLY